MPVWNMLGPRPIKLTVTKYGFAHVYKLTTYLASLEKVSLYNKIPLLIVSKNCLGKQFTKTILGTCSNSTGASDKSFYPIFKKGFDQLETLLTICRPKKVLSAQSLCGRLLPSPQPICP